jgi:hypothetical protein
MLASEFTQEKVEYGTNFTYGHYFEVLNRVIPSNDFNCIQVKRLMVLWMFVMISWISRTHLH